MPRDSTVRPVEELADVLRVFMRSTTVRALSIRADARLNGAAVGLVRAFEFHADNRSPQLMVVAKALGGEASDDVAWEATTDALREAFERGKASGAPLTGLPARPLSTRGVGSFCAQVLQCLGAVSPPAQGLLLVLQASAKIPAPRIAELAEMARAKGLADVRWILLSPAEQDVKAWVAGFGKGRAIDHRAAVDESVAIAEIGAELDAMEALGPGWVGAGPKGVRPPPRPRRFVPRGPPPVPADRSGVAAMSDEAAGPARVSGDGPPHASPAPGAPDPPQTLMWSVRIAVQRAALAMRAGDGPAAIVHQAAARDACIAAGEEPEAVRMEMMLGAYLLDLGQNRLACEAFARAGTRAVTIDDGALAAEAFIARGSAETRDGQPVAALEAYRHGIQAAEAAGLATLALHAYWQAGQVALALNLEIDCIGLWADAVVYAEKADPTARAGSPAKAMAGSLAELLVRHRRFSEAREIERRSAGF